MVVFAGSYVTQWQRVLVVESVEVTAVDTGDDKLLSVVFRAQAG